MKAFANLYAALDETTKTNQKVEALSEYFQAIKPAEGAWAIYFLSGRKLKQLVPSKHLRAWAAEAAGIPDWLFGESYDAVGDLAETMALLVPPEPEVPPNEQPLNVWVEERLLPLRELEEAQQRDWLLACWRELDTRERFVWNKLITGGFRVGVSQRLVVRGLAQASGVEAAALEHRLMGNWEPTPEFYRGLLDADASDADHSRPYPFFLAHPLEAEPESLGDLHDWQAEWKWDGIRAQLIRRRGETFLWSRGEELVTDRYPELHEPAALLGDGTALDGELLAWRDGQVLPFGQMQRRIGRKTLGKKILQEVPVSFMAYDLLEAAGEDLRPLPLQQRREKLTQLLESLDQTERILLSPLVTAESWQALANLRSESRERLVEGLMLKRTDSPYRVGRVRGDWWKWKIEPLTIDAVLIYAQRGSGRRASLYTDYTFAVWKGNELVPFAKAYSGLTDEEIREVDAFVRKNTQEKFGPVRSVKPELVFELAFENIQRSTRHKSGVAVRFPRILRRRTDKRPEQADSLETVLAGLPAEPA